jgi:hypothetical protein
MKLNLADIFDSIQNEKYVVMKLSDTFPDYQLGSDIDILCQDNQQVVSKVIPILNTYISDESKVKVTDYGGQIHVDILENGRIHLRFDLYSKNPGYKNVVLRPEYYVSVIEHSRTVNVGSINVKVPALIDDLMIRYLEYQEYYSHRPDKIKHIVYIEEKIKERQINPSDLFDRLHYYSEIPDVDMLSMKQSQSTRSILYFLKKIKRISSGLKHHGVWYTFNKIKRVIWS